MTRTSSNSRARRTPLRDVALAAAFVLLAPVAHAATLLETSVEQMLFGSELVVEGEVVAVDRTATLPDRASRYPWTAVSIAVRDVVKGDASSIGADGVLTLHFVGGVKDGIRVEVPGMRVPGVGTHAVFFVERVAAGLANPLFGWHQGELHIKPDASGAMRTYTATGTPVMAVGRGALRGRLASASGAAAGISMSSDARDGMSPSSFKLALRAMLAEGSKGASTR